MRAEDLEKEIDGVLTRMQIWEPPAHFARNLSAKAIEAARRELAAASELSTVSIMSPGVGRAALLGFLVAATANLAHFLVFAPMVEWLASDRAAAVFDTYVRFTARVSEQLIANAIPLAWVSTLLSLAVAAWFARGVRPFSFRPR